MSEPSLPRDPADVKRSLRILFFVVFVDLLGFGLIIPLLPFYALKFEASALQVTMLASLYSLFQFLSAPALGAWSDRIGRRPVLAVCQLGSCTAFVLLAISSVVHWPSASVGLAVLFGIRVIDGISGGNISVAQAFVSDVTGPAERTGGMALLGAAFGIGFATGPAIGGLLGEISPALPPAAGAACCLTAALLTWTRLPDTRRRVAPEQLPEPMIDDFAEPAQEVSRNWLRLSRDKLTPIVLNRLLLQLILIWFLAMFSFVILESIFAVFAEKRFGFGPGQVGGFFALAGVTIIFVQGFLVGRLSKRFGDWPLCIAGPTLVAIAMVLMIVSSRHGLLWLVYVAGVVNSAGRSLHGPTLSALVSRTTPGDQQGTTFGVYHGMGALARMVGPLAAGGLFGAGLTFPFFLAAITAAAAATWLLALAIRHRSPRPAVAKANPAPAGSRVP